jgi:hypothetical protein
MFRHVSVYLRQIIDVTQIINYLLRAFIFYSGIQNCITEHRMCALCAFLHYYSLVSLTEEKLNDLKEKKKHAIALSLKNCLKSIYLTPIK